MFIKRVCVEEGFLHGLDLNLGHGLTVLIGARGSGKTSIIELIRFCLAAPSYTEGGADPARKQALAVLGSGKVTVTLDVDGEEVTFMRSADEPAPRPSTETAVALPIVLSQNEIERVGKESDSRLLLLDGFVPALRDNERSEDAARALISSLTVELRAVLTEARGTDDDLAGLASVPGELLEARAKETEASAHLQQAVDQRTRLDEISKLSGSVAVRLDTYARAERAVAESLQRAGTLINVPPLEDWPVAADADDRLAEVRQDFLAAHESVRTAAARLELAAGRIRQLREAELRHQVEIEDEARGLRTFIDQLSEGAGLLIKHVSDLGVRQQRADSLRERRVALDRRATEITGRREAELDKLDALREARVSTREQAAAFLNGKLGPRIRLTVNRFGSIAQYTAAIAEALRGSGLQYNVLAPELARTMSPRELSLAAESNDSQAITTATGIALERAQRVANHLRDFGTETVLTTPMGDTVELALLDGGSYKLADALSVGQRCTAVLPIILSHTERVLIVDQPEDNLDNSFVADTLVKALRNRPSTSQLVFATHNPNVPVLGEADRVVFLTSDGKRGDVTHVGQLDDPQSVRAITDVMEGGREAFAKRAAFYGQEPPLDETS